MRGGVTTPLCECQASTPLSESQNLAPGEALKGLGNRVGLEAQLVMVSNLPTSFRFQGQIPVLCLFDESPV